MELYFKVEELLSSSNATKKIISEYLLDNPDTLSNTSMQEIADSTYTSKATLVRYAQKFGYKGWNDFVFDYLLEYNSRLQYCTLVDANIPFSSHTSTTQILENIANLQIESIKGTQESIFTSDLEKCSEIIMNSNKIYVFGLHPNAIIAKNFSRKMKYIGYDIYVGAWDEHSLMASLLNEHDCAILITYSGNNKFVSPMVHCDVLKKNKVKIIGITSMGDNYIRKNSDVTLSIYSQERLYSKIANYSTEQSISYIFNVLYSVCFQKNYSQNLIKKCSFSKNHEGSRETHAFQLKEDESL